MKYFFLFSLCCILSLHAETKPLTYSDYLSSFTYQERKDMKIGSIELVAMLEEGVAQLVDVRFKEEYESWHMPASINIPLNELPKRLNELDKSKVIVTACPHKDRAIMARTFLKLKGYEARYLKGGLIGLAEYLRGDNAREFVKEYNLMKSSNQKTSN